VSEFDILLSDARRRLADIASDGVGARQPGPATATGLGGRITVEMAGDGRLVNLALDPTVLAIGERELAREIMAAVNNAWARRQVPDDESAAALAAVAGIDMPALQRELAELQDRGLATMRSFTESLQATVARIEQAAAR
jgi:DNA-binding protein YbaB